MQLWLIVHFSMVNCADSQNLYLICLVINHLTEYNALAEQTLRV